MSHWYAVDGTPNHTIVGKNGKERNVTLRDARKKNLFPSVTTILNVLDKPGLNNWKLDQLALSMLTLPKIDGESLEDFKERAKVDSKEQVVDAANIGTEIHDSIEQFFKGNTKVKYIKSALSVYEEVAHVTGFADGWTAEKRFACPYGYAGMVDLHHESGSWVVDFKTKDGDEDAFKKIRVYDEQIMQVSAYAHGLGFPSAKKMNVFVSRTHPGVVKSIVHDKCYFEQFRCLVKYWQLSKGYAPEYEPRQLQK